MAKGRAYLGLIAGAAMLGSHWLAYVFAAPGGHERAHLLQATGHGYWPLAATFAIAAAVIGLTGFVATRFGRPDPARTPAHPFLASMLLLSVLQVGGFAALEVIERVLTGHSVGFATFAEPTMLVGLVVQVLAALASAALLTGLAAAVDLIRRLLTPPVGGATPPLELTSLIPAYTLLPATGAASLRGPPRIS